MNIKSNKMIAELSNIISEIARNEKNKSSIEYIDVDNNSISILGKTNHVIFGRRGAGKSTLIFEAIKKISNKKNVSSFSLDCEEFKNHSFPKVIIEIFIRILKEVDGMKGNKLFHKAHYILSSEKKNIHIFINELESMYDNDFDEETTAIKSSSKTRAGMEGSINSIGAAINQEDSFFEDFNENKDYGKRINLMLPRLKEALDKVIKIKGYNHIYLFFDDFYHLPLTKQAEIADFIHRLVKNKNITFKISTIKHRAILYKPTGEEFYGIQENQDYEPIDLDKTFESFMHTKVFLENLFLSLLKRVGISDIKDVFAGESFHYLVLGSGGVPRDFLNLFNRILRVKNDDGKINKKNVLDASASLFSSKKEEFQRDIPDSNDLFKLFEEIERFCLVTKKRTVFAISDDDKSLIDKVNKLVDFKLFHTVLRNVSHTKHKGNKYTYYILDLGLYGKRSTTRKYGGKGIYEVDIMDINEQKRLDNIRTAPIFSY